MSAEDLDRGDARHLPDGHRGRRSLRRRDRAVRAARAVHDSLITTTNAELAGTAEPRRENSSLQIAASSAIFALLRTPECTDRVEEGVAEVGGLFRADAVDLMQVVDRLRPALDHIAQRRFVKDNVGRHAALARPPHALAAQDGEQLL